MPRWRGAVMLRAIRSSATAIEIVVDDLAVGAQARLVPSGAELAAAADVGEHVNAAALQPHLADVRRISRRHRDLEAAISRRAALGWRCSAPCRGDG